MIRSVNGKIPEIAESAFVSEAAYIVGDVEIGENAIVWPGAVLRGDFGKIKIGQNTAVEEGCVIHSGSLSGVGDVLIGDNVTIGHGAVLNCRKIGNNTLIGMNSTILHDVEIGNFCIIAAACLVSQGMKIPDRSFVVGVPGRIEGDVSGKKLFWIKESPKHYASLIEKYKRNQPR